MKIINTLFGLSLVVISLSSCSVYYTTSQVDQSLKSSINQANNGLNQLENQVLNLESKYNEIHCDTKPQSVKESDKLLADLRAEMSQINSLKATLNQEYVSFQDYTKGKDRIVSGTPEYEKMKLTRNNIKLNMESLQTKGQTAVKKAQTFSDYVSKNVVSSIQMVDVASYKSKFEQSISDLSNSEQTFYQELKKYDGQMNQVIGKFQTTHASQCASLKSDFQLLNDHQKSIGEVKVDLLSTLKTFQEQTRGMKTISSCSNQWPLVAAADQSIAASQTKLNAIQSEIQKTVGRIEATIKSLK
jgi:hypothetical protein